MTSEQGIAFLEALCAKHIRLKDNGWIEASCPLAPWTHKHHTDQTPSFGLTVAPGARSYFLCFACRQGSAEELLHTLELYAKGIVGFDFPRCHKLLDTEQYVVPLPEYREFGQPGLTFVEWPQFWLESFQKVAWVPAAVAYLQHRGVSQTEWEQYDLRYDSKRHRIVAPYRDVFGRLAGARGRAITDTDPQKHYDYTFQSHNNARLVWFHEPALNLHGPVVVVEGQFDVMRVAHVFPKVVGALTSKPTLEKMKKLGDCPLVLQIPDRDEAGAESVIRYRTLAFQLGLRYKTVWLDEGVKDPAEAHPDYLRDKITEAL